MSVASVVAPVVTSVVAGLNPTALISSLAEAGIGTVVISGLQSQAGQNALDPLHLIFKPNTTTTVAQTPTTGTTTTATAVPTATSAAFNAMPPATQIAFLQAGGHVSN